MKAKNTNNSNRIPGRKTSPRRILVIIITTVLLLIGLVIVVNALIFVYAFVPHHTPNKCYSAVNTDFDKTNISTDGKILSRTNGNDSVYGDCIRPYVEVKFMGNNGSLLSALDSSVVEAGFKKENVTDENVINYTRQDGASVDMFTDQANITLRFRMSAP